MDYHSYIAVISFGYCWKAVSETAEITYLCMLLYVVKPFLSIKIKKSATKQYSGIFSFTARTQGFKMLNINTLGCKVIIAYLAKNQAIENY